MTPYLSQPQCTENAGHLAQGMQLSHPTFRVSALGLGLHGSITAVDETQAISVSQKH